MTRRETLIRRILARPPEASFRDVRALLEDFGYVLQRQKGSHVTFTRPGERPIIFPLRHGRGVIRVYLDQIIATLELEEP